MTTQRKKGLVIAAILELALAVGIVSFWTAFFTTDMIRMDDPRLKEIYMAFESAFPVADGYLSVVLVVGAVGLLRKKAFGRLFSLVGGASLVFLGLLDISFNTLHGIYRLGLGEAVMNLSVNLICLGAGIFLILVIWESMLD